MRRGREKGKSHSTRPSSRDEALIAELDTENIKNRIIELAKKGIPPSKIGIILRDEEGVPLVKHVFGKKLVQLLKEWGLAPQIPEDLQNLINRANNVIEHLKEHPKDYRAKRGLEEIISKINRLAKYYKREGILPPNWEHGLKIPKT
ncbi:MAG: 30S ribosomal protein S15 [Thermoproteota archaeon]|jgi:small subunit ribosomal protein S15|nr:30S ribosomal protein S15 [Thermoproteota archaeon]